MKINDKSATKLNSKAVVATLLISVLVTACGGGDTNNSGNNPGLPNTGTATILEGRWLKPCGLADDNGPFPVYDVVQATFRGNRFSSQIYNYTDVNCTVPFALSPNPSASGVFELPGITLTTTSGLQAEHFNSQITQSIDGPFDNDDFDIYYLTGDTLYFGFIRGANDGTSPALRPDTLDLNRGFIRQ